METSQQVYVDTCPMKKLKKSPFSIHVIIKEKIRNNGYHKLVYLNMTLEVK